jgi:hypothetical protein
MPSPVFSGPLDQHPFFAAQREAAQKVAHATAAVSHAVPKAAPRAAPPKTAPAPSPFTKLPPNALASTPKLTAAVKGVERPAKAPVRTPALTAMTKPVTSLTGLPKAPSAPGKEGVGPAILGAITSPGKSLAAVASDVPKELHGTGFLTHDLPRIVGTAETKGYENILGSHGVGGSIAKTIGAGLREIPELPAQVIPAGYLAGKVALNYAKNPDTPGRPNAEAAQVGKSLAKESVLAHLAKGDLKGAVETLKRRPVSSVLEVSGAGAAVDRAAGAAGRAGAFGSDVAGKAALADPGATDLSRGPQELLGEAREPLPERSKRLSVALRQNKQDPSIPPGQSLQETLRPHRDDPATNRGLASRLVNHLDQKNADIRMVQKHNITSAVHDRMDAVAGKGIKGTPFKVPIPGHEASNLFARGLLADPKVMDHITGQPLYRTQLSDLTKLHAKPVEGETLHEKAIRESNVANAQGLLDNARFQKDPAQAKAAAVKYAQDMQKLEPQLIDAKVLTPQSARVAKLVDPFQFHWRDQDPRVEETPPLNEKGQQFVAASKAREDSLAARRGSLVEKRRAEVAGDKGALKEISPRHDANVSAHKAAVAQLKAATPASPLDLHESPFSIAGDLPGTRIHLPVDEVEKLLLQRHGVDPKEIGFISNRPYVNKDAQFYKNGQDPTKAGFWGNKFRTGSAFKNGLYDSSHDAMVRQHATNQGIVDQVHASRMQVKDYFLTREHAAKLLEKKLGTLHPQAQTAVKQMVAELRAGRDTYFKGDQSSSAWVKAQRAAEEVRELTGIPLTPGRIASPYAPVEQLDAIAKHTVDSIQDRLDPNAFNQDRGTERFPTDPQLQHDAGTVGLVHQSVAKQMQAYDKQQGSPFGKLFRAPANFWRISNIALSPKHPIGIAQELGIRAAANSIGPMSLIREHRMSDLWERALDEPGFLKDNPQAQQQYALLQAHTRGTEGQQALNLTEHLTGKDLAATTRTGAALRAIDNVAEHKIVGAPLRAARSVMKGYMAVTMDILKVQEKFLGHPALQAGVGKHVNDEVKRLTGQSVPLVGEMSDRAQEIIRGQITNPDALAATSRKLIEYYGNWSKASPKAKNMLAVAPFWNWYTNSLKFVYHTLPMNHPIKTAVAVTLENATAAQRKAIGEGHGSVEPLEPEQQGGIPVGKGYTSTPQHYTPFGAVNSPLETLTGMFLPEIQDAYKAATGSNPYGETLENKNKEPVTAENERVRYAATGLLESFLPPLRTIADALAGGKKRTSGTAELYGKPEEDPVGKALGVPPGVWKAIEPLRIALERTEKGPRLPKTPNSNRESSYGKEAAFGKEPSFGKEASYGKEAP